MTSSNFIKRIRVAVYEASIHAVVTLLEKPSGRSPFPKAIEFSKWYNSLSIRDKEHVGEIIRMAARSTVFTMLTVLDGVKSVRAEGEDRGILELRYITGKESVLLNEPKGELLHDLFAGEVPTP